MSLRFFFDNERLISNYFAEFAALYSSDQFFSLIGGFLFLRYFNPGLSSPQAFGVLPENKPLPPVVARNAILITKVLQVREIMKNHSNV